MSVFEKIKIYSENLSNELISLEVISQNLETQSRELTEKETNLTLREKKVAERESKVLSDIHAIEEIKKQNEKDTNDIEVKRIKLNEEWQRMITDKTKIE